MKAALLRIARGLRAVVVLCLWRATRLVFQRRERAPLVLDFRGHSVRIERGAAGLPHVAAEDAAAVWFGQGFAMALDRLWQMDLLRRQALGRLSEVFGTATLESDRFHRALRIEHYALRSQPSAGSEAARMLDAFCEGINAAARRMRTQTLGLPVEFKLLQQPLEPWRVADSLAVLKLMSLQLGMSAKYKAVMHELLKQVTAAQAATLAARPCSEDYLTLQAACRHSELPVPVPSSDASADLLPLLAMMGQSRATGSNGWVLAPSRSANGRPLLCNDPHLPFGVPALLHAVHLKCGRAGDSWEATGVNVPGLPGLVAGHNGDIAWGITNSQLDVQDLVTHGESDGPFERTSGWEAIGVRGGPPDSIDVCTTRAGPSLASLCGVQLSFAWSGLLPGGDIAALMAMPLARDWAGFRSALRGLQSLSLNVLFASRSGDIAMKTTGRLPRRMRGLKHAPAPLDWCGFADFDELPEVVNPPGGLIVSANNPIAAEAGVPSLALLWNPSFRARRIHELLVGRRVWWAADMQEVLDDNLDLQARDLLPGLLDLLQARRGTSGPAFDHALDLLAAWDCRTSPEAQAPWLWDRLLAGLGAELYGARLAGLMPYFENRVAATTRLIAAGLADEPSPWLAGRNALGDQAAAVLGAVVRPLPRLRRWPTWGRRHRLGFRHPLSAALGPLRRWVDLPSAPCAGNAVTVALHAGSPEVVEGPVWSTTVSFDPFGSVADSRLLPGQCGDFRSRWYVDQAARRTLSRTFAKAAPRLQSATAR